MSKLALKRNILKNILCVKCVVLTLLLSSCNKTNEINLPTVTTISVTNIATITATSGGNILSDGGDAIITSGVCWSLKQNPSINDSLTVDSANNETYSSSLSGLASNTTYYLKAYATNSKGTAYGNEISFKTNPLTEIPKTVTDFEGNVYHTVQINDQVWLEENLRSTKYRNGEPISNVTNENDWTKTENGAYCWYRNKPEEFSEYGVIYNLNAATDNRGIAPNGWHIPSLAEYRVLIKSLGGFEVAGGKLKEPGIIHWESPNNTDPNSSNFNALPGGYRDYNGGFNFVTIEGMWWSTTPSPVGVTRGAWGIILDNRAIKVGSLCFLAPTGAYVRCLMN